MKQRFDPFLALLESQGIPSPVTEYLFAEDVCRRFRADYCWRRGFELPDQLAPEQEPGLAGVIVEKDGGTWTKGAHSSGRGILRDMEKSNLANELGFCYLRFTPEQLCQQETLNQIRRCLGV